ncbi:MAG: hypothetical protein GWN53_18845, partial [Gammaproteobacteria bacterium]|nr:hypothetical protein [Gammaproteobacteria bacterium]
MAVAAVAGISSHWMGSEEHLALHDQFKPVFRVASYYLDDLGVADIDDDGALDLYTTNHSAAQHILLGRGDGHFEPVALHELGLQHTPGVPGAETIAAIPSAGTAGLHIYPVRESLVLRAKGLGIDRARLRVAFPWPARITQTGAIDTARSASDWATSVDVSITGDGELWIEPEPGPATGFPIRIELLDGLDREHVRVGA